MPATPHPAANAAPDFRPHADALRALARGWRQGTLFAQLAPDAPAVIDARGTHSFRTLEARVDALLRALHAHGLRPGDALALVCGNRVEFVEVLLAALRAGLRLTPVNAHLTAPEVDYIVRDSGAKLAFVEAGLSADGLEAAPSVRIGQADYEAFLASAPPHPAPVAAAAGTLMLYTSGTTGRPKGVRSDAPDGVEPQFDGSFADYRPGDVQLCAGPAYHSAPLLFDVRWPLASGVPIVMLPRWDAEIMLEAVASHRVTHLHLVPTMFARLLALPAPVRARHDLSSLRFVIHGASPCPVHVKRAMIDWWGPVLTEYYAATEGGAGVHVTSQDWLRRPGTVGRLSAASGHRILDEQGQDVPPGTAGRVFFRAPADPAQRFRYHGDPEKTAGAYAGDLFTLGDIGYVDDDGWLFLTGRSAETIIRGGVNIYPREVDDALRSHPAVADVCTVGAPDDELGERVVAVVVPADGHSAGPDLAEALLHHAAARLAHFKRPREILFDDSLPHSATGKLLRSQVRARFWAGRQRAI
jgi:long-chain acyl-CoA synthetase